MMGSAERLRARFRAQFTPAERGWVYRRGGRGPALPVGDQDRDALIAGFERASRWLSWGGIVAAAAMFGVLEWWDVHPSRWVTMAAFLVPWGAAFWFAWNAPHRLLNGRAPLAPGLSGREVRRHGLQTLPWSVLALGALLCVGLVGRTQFEADPWSTESRGYYAWAAGLLAFFAAIAVAKRRAER